MPDIILHLGAHKTATTTIQRTLVNNRQLLLRNGVLAPKLLTLRDNVTFNLVWTRYGLTKKWPLHRILMDNYSEAEIKTAKRIILSDENIIGYLNHIFSRGRFYTDIDKRCKNFAKWLPEQPSQIVLAVRPYAGFFRSAYGQWLGPDSKFKSREHAQKTILSLDRGWPEVVADLQAQFPNVLITVMRYRRRQVFTQQALALLVGAIDGGVEQDKKMFWNKGMNDQELTEMETGLIDNTLDAAKVDALRDQKIWGWPRNSEGFWDDDARRVLNEKFEQDCAKIALMPGIDAQL